MMVENSLSEQSLSLLSLVAQPHPIQSRRDQILVAATRMFLKQGYGKTSMDQVAKAAGVARRTLYNQFPEGKTDLFRLVVEKLWCAFPVLDIVAQTQAQRDVKAGLTSIARAIVDFWTPPVAVDFLRMVIAEGRRFPQLTEIFFSQGKLPAMAAVRQYLETQARAGQLKINDFERAARQFLGLIDEPLLWIRVIGWPESSSEQQRQAVIEEAVTMFLLFYGTAAEKPL